MTSTMILALSDAAWGFLGLLVFHAAALIALLINSHRTRVSINDVNRAVNHQPVGSPTLVERVGSIERDYASHRCWVQTSLRAVAAQVGTSLPPNPHQEIPARPKTNGEGD